MSLKDANILVKVSVHRFSFRDKDKEMKKDLTDKYEVDPDMLSLTKSLFLKESIKDIERACGQIMPMLYKYTTPWRDGGWRLLPIGLQKELEDELRAITDVELQEALQKFAEGYDDHVLLAKNKLGLAFREESYPGAEYILDKFNVDIRYDVITDESDLKVNAPEELRDKLFKNAQERAIGEKMRGMEDIWVRVKDIIEHAYTRLTAIKEEGKKEPKLFASIITNIQDLVPLLTHLNFTGDPHLEAIRKEIEEKFADITIEDIKKDDDLKKEKIADTKRILDDIATVL